MKTSLIAVAILALGIAGHAQADSTSNAQQTSTSQSVAQGTIQFSQTPADTHVSETVRNVSAPILGAYASSFSQMNCSSTTQGGFSIAGFSGALGSSKDSNSCVLEVAAAEITRQATVTEDPVTKVWMGKAAMNIRCRISPEVHDALEEAGYPCGKNVPSEMKSRTDDQPASTRVAGN
ncbi:hypothetical protein [Caballeronia sordidicola]|uniref:hypothetical protein n=1 Tax=Caballeronia sordidicola TaxID=196367 RepID=UPI00094D2AC9|nr:hypothetical protein [Caballeronia sordidicola]